MAAQFQSSLSSFASWLRARRRGPVVLTLLAWVFLAQTLLIVHRIDHHKAEHSVSCALCVAADHLAGAAEAPAHVIEPPQPAAAPVVPRQSDVATIRVAYRSRAPPRHFLA